MLIGVIYFSYSTGTLSSIIANYDSEEAKAKEKIMLINVMQSEYKFAPHLFNKLIRQMQVSEKKQQVEIRELIDNLPHKLKLEVEIVIHAQMYKTIKFFSDKDHVFISWIACITKRQYSEERDYIYKEGEEANECKIIIINYLDSILPF